MNIPPIDLGIGCVRAGDKAIMAPEGGGVTRSRRRVRFSAGREFAGYWEYVLDRAISYRHLLTRFGAAPRDRRRRQIDRYRLAACARHANGRRAPPRCQHGSTDRPPAADPRRHADYGRPNRPTAPG